MAVALFLTLLRVRQTRRKMMFTVTLASMLFAFLGFTLLDAFLTEHPLLFALYWFFCTSLVLFMLLLSIYDYAAVKGDMNRRSDQQLAAVLKDIEEAARANKKEDPDKD